MKKALVFGAGGFIGSHLVKRLKREGYWVRGVDLKIPEFGPSAADEMWIRDLRSPANVVRAMHVGGTWGETFDEVYQLAADMGGAGYIFTGDHDAEIMHNSATINLNVVDVVRRFARAPRLFYSSSACIYPARNQTDPMRPHCAEDSAYPAAPDSEYGWEKLFSERLYIAAARNHGLQVRVARFHNIFGPEGTYKGGREKAPAAICRKVAESRDGEIVLWGPGDQTRSFLFVDECVEGIRRIMASDCDEPLNLGSEEMVMRIAGKELRTRSTIGPVGVMGRNSDNRRIRARLGWAPSASLVQGLQQTYRWIERMVRADQAMESSSNRTAMRGSDALVGS
jgi:GDP-D-mannose 3', 5'-epimerase